MTNLGRLTPISFYGALRFGQSALSLATNQQSMKVFTGSSAFGKKEKVDSVSASVMLGKKAKIGSGYIDIITKDKTVIEREKTEDVNTELQNEDIVEQQNIDTNKSYMDVMFNTYESEIYGRKRMPGKDSPRPLQINETKNLDSQQQRESKINTSDPSPPVISPSVISPSVISPPVISTPVISTPVISTPVSSTPVISTPVISPILTLPKKTSVRLNGLADITSRMKSRKIHTKNEEVKIQIRENLDVLKDL
jgi:hypothetical protein